MNEDNSQSESNNDTFYSIEATSPPVFAHHTTTPNTTSRKPSSLLVSSLQTTTTTSDEAAISHHHQPSSNLASGFLSFFKSLPSSLTSTAAAVAATTSSNTASSSSSSPPPLATPRRPLKRPSGSSESPAAAQVTTTPLSSSKSRSKKSVKFDRVDLFLFDRCQGFTSVPSTSLDAELVPCVSVGMTYKHAENEQFNSVEEYAKFKRKMDLIKLEEYFRKKIKEMKEEAVLALKARVPAKRGRRKKVVKGKKGAVQPAATVAEAKESVDMAATIESPGSEAATSPTPQENEPLIDLQKLISTDTDLVKISDILANREYYETNPSIDLDVSPDVLCPIMDQKERFNLLHNLQVEIDPEESEEIKLISTSREECGCLCGDYNLICEPSNPLCSCVQNGIMCQLDRVKYPCHCSVKKCKNPFGFKRFNYQQVIEHYNRVFQQSDEQNQHQPQPAAAGAVFNEEPMIDDNDNIDQPPGDQEINSDTVARKRKRKITASPPQKRKKQMKSKAIQPQIDVVPILQSEPTTSSETMSIQ